MSTCTITYTDPVLGDRVFTREQFKQFVLNNPALFSEMVGEVKSETTSGSFVEVDNTPSEIKINTSGISDTLALFLDVYLNKDDERLIDPVAKKLTDTDKEALANAVGKKYKDIKQFDWYNDLFDIDSVQDVKYFFKTGKVLNVETEEKLADSKLNKDYQTFYNEQIDFVKSFNSLSEESKKELRKDFDKAKEKYNWFTSELDSLRYKIRQGLINSTTVMKSPITVNDYVNSELENSIFLFDPRNDSNFEEHFNKCKR